MKTKLQIKISICGLCQLEYPKVDAQVKESEEQYSDYGEIIFSHGYCLRHYEEILKKSGQSDEQIKIAIQNAKNKGYGLPDLKERPDLVNLYSKGIFTQEQLHQVQQSQQQDNQKITERFKTLAGIRS